MKNNLYKNKYRIPSARLQNWDYRWNAAYFITICTAHMEHYFGEIYEHSMQLSHVGVLTDVFWYEIKNHAKNVELDAFVVIPNHVHGILVLNNENHSYRTEHSNDADVANRRDVACNVSTSNATPNNIQNNNPKKPATISKQKNEFMASISPKSGSVSVIIRSYKSAVTKHAHRLGFEFEWQTRFNDHIIRNPAEYKRIFDYIIDNPKNWGKDKFFTKNK